VKIDIRVDSSQKKWNSDLKAGKLAVSKGDTSNNIATENSHFPRKPLGDSSHAAKTMSD
jgi:hypothetical protein